MDKQALAKAYADRSGKIDTPTALCWPSSDRSKCGLFVEKEIHPERALDVL